MPEALHESVALLEANPGTTGRLSIQVITPGWGSSGYYSSEVCESAAPLFTVGTQMFLDHPSESEAFDRPERSVRDIAAVITEAGRWDADVQAVVAECQLVGAFKDTLTDLVEHIGLSIRGSATDVVEGEAEGRRGRIIEGLAAIQSVDFVTKAGRGGKVLQVLESARPEVLDRAIARGVTEATADERRQQLSDVVRTAYAGDRRYAWVRDFDESTVWFEASAEDERSKTWQQLYTVADDDLSISLTGSRTEVRPVTKYVPVTRSDSTNPTTEESEEDTMGNIQIDEAEHRSIVERAGRVDTLESERDTAIQERDTARSQLAERDRTDRARALIATAVAEHGTAFTPLEERGLLAGLPLTADGDLDEAAFTTTVNEAATSAAATRGSGTVTGFGGTPVGAPGLQESDIDTAVAGAFGRKIGA